MLLKGIIGIVKYACTVETDVVKSFTYVLRYGRTLMDVSIRLCNLNLYDRTILLFSILLNNFSLSSFSLLPLFLLLTIESFLKKKKRRKNTIRIFTRNPQQCVSRWTINIRKLKHLTFRYDTRNIYIGVYVSLRISSNRGFTFTCRERSESMMRVSLSMPAINEHENVPT